MFTHAASSRSTMVPAIVRALPWGAVIKHTTASGACGGVAGIAGTSLSSVVPAGACAGWPGRTCAARGHAACGMAFHVDRLAQQAYSCRTHALDEKVSR